MDFDFSPEEDVFRETVRTFLEENLPHEFDAHDPKFLKQWNPAQIGRASRRERA